MARGRTTTVVAVLVVLLTIRSYFQTLPAVLVGHVKQRQQQEQQQQQQQQQGLNMTLPSDRAVVTTVNKDVEEQADVKEQQHPDKQPQQQQRGDILIAYGLCLSKDAQRKGQMSLGNSHHHEKKPYDIAAALSTRLWKQQDASLKVVVTLAYRGNSDQAELARVAAMIQSAGGLSWAYDVSNYSDPDIACVRASQMSRMFLWESGLVQRNDFVVTSDADLMPVNASRLLKPVRETNVAGDHYRVWVARFWESNWDGFPMAFLGATAADWQLGLQRLGLHDFQTALEAALRAKNYPWGFDQAVATVALMHTMTCRFKANAVWWNVTNKIPSLKPPYNKSALVDMDESLTCIRGTAGGYSWPRAQCLNSIPSRNSLRCVYAHFTPDVNVEMLRSAYTKIASVYPNQIPFTDIIKAATA